MQAIFVSMTSSKATFTILKIHTHSVIVHMPSLTDIFGIKDFIPHGYCLAWSPVLLWLHVISDLLITVAYYSIPLMLVYFIRQRKDLPYPWLITLFAGFIVACGTTHLLSAITIWIPLYWLDGLLKVFTAIISLATAVLMLWVIPRALSAPSTAHLQAEIQQRKATEAALQETLDKLQKIAGRVPGVVYQYRLRPDGSSCFPYASDAIRDIYRVSPEEVNDDASKVFAILHPEDYDGVCASILKSARGLSPWHYEYRVKFDDGTVRWLLGNALIQREADGSTLWHGFITDITERKQAERNLIILKAMIDISLDGFWIADTTGKVLQANEAYAKMTGYSTDELVNMNIHQLEALESAKQVSAHIEKVVTQGYDQFETRHRHKDGRIIDIEISVAFLPEFQQFSVFCRDITQRKQMETKLNAIFDASVEAIVTFDRSGIMVSANAAVETIFGYKPEELKGCSIGKLIPSSIRDIAPMTSQIQEIDGIHKNGDVVPLDLSIAQYALDNTAYSTYIVRDVSLRKLREQQNKEHLNQLAHVTRLGLMGEMASGIAHEVNQPLTAISSYAQVCLNLINTENPDLVKLAEILDKTRQQALRAGRIIHRMREFVKSQSKQHAIADINALIHETVSLCIAELKQNDIKLTLELENNLPPIRVDQIQIEQVIINLIRNSIDALQSLPEKQQRHISIHSGLTADNRIEVRVTDNGPGLDESLQQKILMPFYTTKADGMGMGLSISRSLIEAHDGSLQFDSQPGKGSTFYFTLPTQ